MANFVSVASSSLLFRGYCLREIQIELDFERHEPELDLGEKGLAKLCLGAGKALSEIREILGSALTDDEWLEVQILWSEDHFEGRIFRALPHGRVLISRDAKS